MFRHISIVGVLLLVLPAVAQESKQAAPTPAKVTITADLGCLRCDLKASKTCAAALLIDKKTPALLAGKLAKDFEKFRCDGKVLVAEGTLSRDEKQQLVLTGDKGALHTAANKQAPAKGTARVEGTPICGRCDLALCDECTLAVANGKQPIILDGKHAADHAHDYKAIAATGRLFVDQRGLLRLEATRVDVKKRD